MLSRFTTNAEEILSIDVRSLALFRVFIGLYIVIDVFEKFSLVPAFFSDGGIIPRHLVNLSNIEYAYHFQLMMVSGSEVFSYLFLSIILVLGLLLTIGYKTRTVTFFTWLFFCSLIVRGDIINNSGDILTIMFLFWGFFLPLGAAHSIDALKSDAKRESSLILSAATIGLYMQFMLLYITTGIYKASYSSWLDGTHLYLTFSRFEFTRPLALLLYPNQELLTFFTHFTLYLELFGPLLFIIPFFFFYFRMAGIVIFLGLHVSIALIMNIGIFPIVSIAGILVFLPSGFWDARLMNDSIAYLKDRFAFLSSLRHNFLSDHNNKITVKNNVFTDLFLCFSIMYVFLWNMSEISNVFSLPHQLKKPGYYLKLDQRWAMFSATTDYGEYYQVVAYYKDGSESDLIENLKIERNYTEPYYRITFRSERWRKVFSERIIHTRNSQYRPTLVEFLVKTNSIADLPDNEVMKVELIGYRHIIGKNYDHSPITPRIIYTKNYYEEYVNNEPLPK